MSGIEQAAPLVQALERAYQHGFVTEIESDALPPGLDEDTLRAISRRKREPDFLLQWRLAAFRRWQAMEPPAWGRLQVDAIDFQALSYYSAPPQLTLPPCAVICRLRGMIWVLPKLGFTPAFGAI